MTKTSPRIALTFAIWLASAGAALAGFAARPFAVAGGEGGGGAEGGLVGWLIAEQSRLTHLMAAEIHSLRYDHRAAWMLVALGLAYGVVHAAGPGHGKAVIASYMLANERSLKRGALLSLLAALLQAGVAIALVGAAGFVFNATASEMNRAANWTAFISYCGVAAIGVWLVWRKGRALAGAVGRHIETGRALSSAPLLAGSSWSAPRSLLPSFAFRASTPGGEAAVPCACAHALNPSAMESSFSWRDAAGTVIAAGLRPCSGAILVLVFALAQGLFAAGVGAALAMALGTAATTAALASIAVFFKSTALRMAAGENSRLALVARTFEFAAALAVLVFGVALLCLGPGIA
ncbi:MAG: high frequency lysogenization protein HflD [Hyphomicrobiales bacterium]|nr:high frequency lysogenization protein HflD [Hyphomicrobiales bacterium]